MGVLPCSRAGPYETYEGSPVSQGKLQFDMWNVHPDPELGLDWAGLRESIATHGVRNSLLVSLPLCACFSSELSCCGTVVLFFSRFLCVPFHSVVCVCV